MRDETQNLLSESFRKNEPERTRFLNSIIAFNEYYNAELKNIILDKNDEEQTEKLKKFLLNTDALNSEYFYNLFINKKDSANTKEYYEYKKKYEDPDNIDPVLVITLANLLKGKINESKNFEKINLILKMWPKYYDFMAGVFNLTKRSGLITNKNN